MPGVRTRPPARPTVRLRPVPPLDPPFDDECVAGSWAAGPATICASGTAATGAGRLAGVGPDGGSARADAPAPASALGQASTPTQARDGGQARGGGHESQPGGRRARSTPASGRAPGPPLAGPRLAGSAPATARLSADALAGATPEAKWAARRFLDSCLEIFNGYRPVAHARSLAGPTDAATVVEQLTAGAARVRDRRQPGRPAPVVRLQRLRVCEPRPGVAEAAAVIGTAGRTWAMAYRLERRRGRWLGSWAEVL